MEVKAASGKDEASRCVLKARYIKCGHSVCVRLLSTDPSGLVSQVRSEIPAFAPQTVLTVCAAPVTSGLASASRCCGRDRFARDTAGRGTTAWSCSSAAPVETDSAAGRCESPAPISHHRRRRLRHHCWRRWQSPSLRGPLPRPATPPLTLHCCPRPRSLRHRHCRLWRQRRDFTCARKTKSGRTD